MKLDRYQQEVVDCNSNAVVSAGAGSGKTTVLARRFLRLISEGRAEVSGILTLTFTRKAAAEMYERIYGLLIENIGNSAAAAAVTDFDKASISTLDSFCSRIARDCCADFGISPFFKTDETAARALARDTALDFILSNSGNPFLGEFIFINGFENIWNDYFVNISMNYLSLGDPKVFSDLYVHQMQTAVDQLAECTREVDELIRHLSSLPPGISRVIDAALELVSGLPSFSDLASVGRLSELFQVNESLRLSKPGGRAVKPEILDYKETVDQLRIRQSVMSEIVCTIENRDLIEGLFELTGDFQNLLFDRKRTAGVLGFQDVLSIAVSGLKKDKRLRRHYKGLYSFIMIDEFQDNNSLQKELLYLLSEREDREADGIPEAADLNPGKLFFVGDEKQSIYRFRGADVSVFKQLSGELEQAGGVSLSLKKNYRSEPGLIEFFNMLFSGVMRNSSEDYQAVFEPLEARGPLLSAAPEITLLYKPYETDLPEDSLGAEESEARAIAEYILDAVGRLEIPAESGCRTAVFEDFAMLFRSGTNQKTYEQVFRAAGIPYSVHSVRSLFQEAPVNDVYNLLQICLYPEDRSASAAFLRSPLANISDLSLVSFLRSDLPVFAEGQESLCADEADLGKYLNAKSLFEKIRGKLDLEPMADIIDDVWYGSGYRYLILRDSSLHGYLEYYDYLRRIAVSHDEEGRSAAEFLDYIRMNLGDYKKIDDLKILGYSSGGVEIMPVHQSKGLEFPVVIIANAGNTGLNDRGGSAPAFISDADGLSFNLAAEAAGGKGRCNYFYSRGRDENRAREEAELRRLLYVALTRAECHLVFSGCHGRQNRSGERSMLNMFLNALGWDGETDPLSVPEIAPYIRPVENRTWSADGGLRKSLANIAVIKSHYSGVEAFKYRLSPNEFSATELNALAIQEHPVEDSAGIIDLPLLGSDLEDLLSDHGMEAEFGTLTHRIIEACIKNGQWEYLPDTGTLADELRPFFRKPDDDGWRLMFSKAAGLAEGFFSSGLWHSSCVTGRAESELAFTSLGENEGSEVFINGVMDLVFEFEDAVRIIDFKTDKRIVPGEYDRQMQIYIEAAAEIFGKPAGCSLFYLRGGTEIKIL